MEITVDIEKYIQDKIEAYNKTHTYTPREDVDEKEINKEYLLSELEKAKVTMLEENKEAINLWKELSDAYFEYMKKHPGSKQLGNLPEKPKLSQSYYKIDGYSQMFKTIIGDTLKLKLSFLEKIFIEIVQGITNAKETTAYMAYCCSGNALGMSDFSLSMNREE